MSLNVARTKIMTSLKELNLKWDQVRRSWDDSVAKEFEETHIVPLEGQARSAVSAIENMTQIVARAKSECQ